MPTGLIPRLWSSSTHCQIHEHCNCKQRQALCITSRNCKESQCWRSSKVCVAARWIANSLCFMVTGKQASLHGRCVRMEMGWQELSHGHHCVIGFAMWPLFCRDALWRSRKRRAQVCYLGAIGKRVHSHLHLLSLCDVVLPNDEV
jgi:hypothetical protein